MKILIIEDEQDLAQHITEYLSEENYLCEFVATYHQALDKIESYHYDCILLDIMLPDGNGMKILEKLKQQEKQDGVIIISVKDALDDKIKGLQIGADDYLTKPFHLAEFSNVVPGGTIIPSGAKCHRSRPLCAIIPKGIEVTIMSSLSVVGDCLGSHLK